MEIKFEKENWVHLGIYNWKPRQERDQRIMKSIWASLSSYLGLPRWPSGETIWLWCRRRGLNPWVGKIPWSKAWQPTPVFLLGETQGQRSLADFSPWSLIELDTTEATETLSFFSSFALFLLCLLNRSLPFHLRSSLSFLPFPSLDFPFRLAPAVSLSSHMTSGFSSTWVSYLFLSPWHVSLLGVYPCIFW